MNTYTVPLVVIETGDGFDVEIEAESKTEAIKKSPNETTGEEGYPGLKAGMTLGVARDYVREVEDE